MSDLSQDVCLRGPRDSEKEETVTSFHTWHGAGSLLPVFSSYHGKAACTRALLV